MNQTVGGETQAPQHSVAEISRAVRESAAWVGLLQREMAKHLIGQEKLVERLLIGLLTGGHILLEGLPGLAKTLSVKTLAAAVSASFRRIQFTPDMLPADIIGTEIYNPRDTSFVVKQGPIFASLILADEINRAPSKVQSALLEAMQERQVTIGESTFPLPELFLVLATQNPIEQEGTYPLPEAQVDRFMLKVKVGYPTREQERRILDLLDHADAKAVMSPILSPEQVIAARRVVDSVYVDDRIKEYIVELICETREPTGINNGMRGYIETGASPRATISLKAAARALAYLNGRGYIIPDDIKSCAPDVLRHRIRVSYEAEAEGITSEDIIRRLLETVPVP
jgi:MoxR-like ATPase